jgi:fructokinase
MRTEPYLIVGLGELLWDLFPSGQQLGGAPANFAYHAALLGDQGIIASRVGQDALGHEALQRLERLGLDTSYVQRDATYPTGTVHVQVDEEGRPDFTIVENVAWDHMQWTPQWQELARQADAVCFGSLAQRSPQSRATIQQFLRATRPDALRIFDVNLRQSFYSAAVLSESLSLSRVAKLNSDELPRLMAVLGLGDDGLVEGARRLLHDFGLELVCITRGADGSILVTRERAVAHPGFKVKVADTVGSGDAFTAALAHYYLRHASLEEINEAANRLGAWVATQVGATPVIAPDELRRLLAEEKAPWRSDQGARA